MQGQRPLHLRPREECNPTTGQSYGLRILAANPPTDCCVSSAKLGARLPRELGAWLPPSREKPPVRTDPLASGPFLRSESMCTGGPVVASGSPTMLCVLAVVPSHWLALM